MKKFFKENWLWLISIAFFGTLFVLLVFSQNNLESWLIGLIKAPFRIIGCLTALYGGIKILQKASDGYDDAIIQTQWQGGFLLFLIFGSLFLTIDFNIF